MHRQRGISLISLLIGLLVSSIVLVGMVMVFRNTIQQVVPSAESARSEGERVSALLAAHMMLQDAGFGTDGDQDEHFTFLSAASLSGTTLSASGAGTAAVWRKTIDTSHTCEGLYADDSGGLWRLGSTSCGSTGIDLASISWNLTPLVEESRIRPDDVGEIVRVIEMELVDEECSPFGISPDIKGDIAVRFKYPVNVGGESQFVESTTCLINFQ